jgi:RNA 2',3'-cyclic 3'-phosphodiesterase
MRLFLAIPLAESVVAEIARFTTGLHSAAPQLRWSARESWHITLQFLGSASEEQLACLTSQLTALRSAPIPIQLAAPGLFERAGIFHLGVELTPGLAGLQQRVVAATTPCGFEPETRPYHAHITLARSKGREFSGELRALKNQIQSPPHFSRFTATDFLLYESHLSSSGSTHEVRHRFPLLPE